MASDRPSVSDQPERKIEVTLNLAGGELTVCVFSKFFQNSPASSVWESNKSRWVYILSRLAHIKHLASSEPSTCSNHDLDYQSNQAPQGGSCPPQWSSAQSRRGQNDQLSDRSPCKYSPDRSNTVLFFNSPTVLVFPVPVVPTTKMQESFFSFTAACVETWFISLFSVKLEQFFESTIDPISQEPITFSSNLKGMLFSPFSPTALIFFWPIERSSGLKQTSLN